MSLALQKLVDEDQHRIKTDSFQKKLALDNALPHQEIMGKVGERPSNRKGF